MAIKLLSPENFDINEVVKRFPFEKNKGMKKDYLSYIIHTVMSRRAFMDDEHLERLGKKDRFVPLQALLLQKIVPTYYLHIDYLIEVGILECDESYQVEEVSKGYRLAEKYITPEFKKVEVTDYILCRKLSGKNFKLRGQHERKKKQHPELRKWFDKGDLTIQEDDVVEWIKRREADEINAIESKKTLKDISSAKSKIYEKYLSYRMQVDRIASGNFYFHIDDFGNRVHTNLTNLSKSLRQFMRYDNKELVGVDIKNSQPYLSLALLNPDFWNENQQSGLSAKMFKMAGVREGRIEKHRVNRIIMFCDSSESLYRSDLQTSTFMQKVASGYIYEHLIEILEKAGEIKSFLSDKEKRDRAKKVFLTLIFDDDKKSYNRMRDSPAGIFRSNFHKISQIFELIKHDDYKNLAMLLQRIESHLVLELACKRISQERPELPIFTVHDSIITTSGNETYIKSILEEELEKAIGIRPKVAVEPWKKKIMKKETMINQSVHPA